MGTHRGFDRNQFLAPEEPNVYRVAINPGIRAPAERNVSGDAWASEHVSLLWSEEESHRRRYIYEHFVPFDHWDEEAARAKNFVRKTRFYELVAQRRPAMLPQEKLLVKK